MVSMEIKRSKLAAKNLRRIIRLALLLIKKGIIISKRKLILHLNLNPPRLFAYHRHGRDYEFSCSSNSPNRGFSRVKSRIRRNYHHLSSCLASPFCSTTSEYNQNAVVLLSTEQYDAFKGWLEEEEEGGEPTVDDDAEEFINRFYQQLRSQNTPYLLA